MDCPACKNTLKPAKLENDLPALNCTNCSGNLVSLLVYRAWTEIHQESASSSRTVQPEEINADETTKGMLCPKCGRIMQKFKISSKSDHKIDLCTGCDEAWLDSGEWQLLKNLELGNKLSSIITEPWQRKIKQEVTSQQSEIRWQENLGETDYHHVKSFKSWLENHPNKAELLRFLNAT